MTPRRDSSKSPDTTSAYLANGATDAPPEPVDGGNHKAEEPATTDVDIARHRAQPRLGVIVACLAVTLALAFDVVTGIDSLARPLLSVVFYLAVPGWAVVGWLDLEDEILSWTLAIGLSVAIGILVAEAMLWAHAWNPDAAFGCLAFAATALLAGRAVRVGPRRPAGRGSGDLS
jgi:hypothetical protein